MNGDTKQVLKQRAKRGLEGNSGIVSREPYIHITAPYGAADDECFVEIETDYHTSTWKRVSLEEAREKNLAIIRCCQCDKPAKKIDHHFPMMCGMNLCDEHEYDPRMDG